MSPTATATTASTAVLAQTASIATRANGLAPTVTATSASTAILVQTASVALRANALAPTVTATSASTALLAQTASVATRANGLAPTATASFADKADEAVTSNIIPVTVVNDGGNKYAFNGVTAPKISLDRGEVYRFDQSDSTNNNHPLRFRLLNDTTQAQGVTAVGTPGQAGAYTQIDVNFATSASFKYYCTVHGNGMGNTVQAPDFFNNSGSFSGSYVGDGSSLTGISSYTVANSANNRIITSVDSGNGNAEANLLFDGSTLNVTGSSVIS